MSPRPIWIAEASDITTDIKSAMQDDANQI